MGFNNLWVNWVMLCVSSVSYLIKVNNEYTSQIVPQRGLRQGDPFSLYLFMLCVEGLSALLQKAEENGKIEGIRVARDAQKLNHLFFADDSLVLMKAKQEDAVELKCILEVYERVSGQVINKGKSLIFLAPILTRW
uniref:Reverse transcriptase domain-containing protein n=1 Tax=Arundo donax TaxID=35708 RepID=A0A0A9D5M0_ARUDO